MLRLKCMIITLLAWQCCLAQDNNAYFHHLTVENGLSEATNAYVFTDSHGFVWISSLSGLNRFDGRQVRVYQPESADSTSVFGQNIQSPFFEDSNNDIWFSTYEGVNRYVRKTDNFKHYTVIDSKTKQPLTGYFVAHFDAKGQLWLIVNEKFIYLFDTKTHQFTQKHTVNAYSQRLRVQCNDQKEVIRSFAYTWSASNVGMQMTEYLEDGKIKQEMLFDKTSPTPIGIIDLFFDKDEVWIASIQGIHKYNFTSKNLSLFYSEAVAIDIKPLSKTELIVTTHGKGVIIIDKSNGKIRQQFDHSADNRHSLAANTLTNNWIDKDRNIWVQVEGHGIDYSNFDKTKFK
jgi:ligand-binding sensor domain-containing protein